ncbi:hypothetical protein D082_19730 [Synechocystis sp. PCC 6714]|nr:hypothetical protein D082_19730 [Synechocystis sp. PCC 6714]
MTSDDNKNIDLIFTKILLLKCLSARGYGDRRWGVSRGYSHPPNQRL